MKSTNYFLWILIVTIIITDLFQVNLANKIGLKDNLTSNKKIIKRRLHHDDQFLDDLGDDSDGTSFFFLPPKTIRGPANRYLSRYIQDSIVGSSGNSGEIPYLESEEEIKSSSTVNSGRSSSILPNGRPGRMRIRRVETSGDHLIDPHSEYNFDDILVPNSSSSSTAKRINANSTSGLDENNDNNTPRSRTTSFGTRRRVKVKDREPGNDPISHFMEVDMKENEDEDKELLDPGSSEIRDTIEPRGGHPFRQPLRNSESSVGSINSGLSLDPYSRYKNTANDFEEPLSRPPTSDSETPGRQSNAAYRPNYEHYESQGGGSAPPPSSGGRGRESIVGSSGLESGFTGIIPGSSSSSSSSSRHHPSLIRSTENSDPVRGIRARYFRPQTVGDYRQSNHAYINGNRLPTILIPNQDIRQQLPRPYYVTTLPPVLTSSPLYTTFSDLSLSGLSGYQSNPSSDFDIRPQRPGRVEVVRRPSSHYRTMIADHLIDEDEGSYNGRGLTTVSPSLPPPQPPTRPTTTSTTTTTPSTPISRPQPISRDYNYGYEADRTRQPNYDYNDQPENPNPRPSHQFNHNNQRGNTNRYQTDRSYRNQFYSQATATTTTSTTTTTTTTTPKPIQRFNNNLERTNDRGQPPNYRSDYDSPPMTATVAPPNDAEDSGQNSGPGYRLRPAGRPGGGRRRRKRPRVSAGPNQGPNRQSTTTTTTTTTTTSAPPPAPYYYDDYEDNDDYEYDYQTTTTTVRPRRKGRRGQGGRGRGQRTSTTPSTTTTTTTTTPATTTRTLSPGYKHRPDNRIIDFMADPNFPHELKGADLTDYPFYISLPTEIHFNCEGRHDGYYASIEHKCQVYHHCALGHRYDFLCPNYTLFDQTTFTCRFVNTVDCLKSENHFNRNDDLYVETTEKPENGAKLIPKNEKERNKRDEKEAIKAEASSRVNQFPIVSTQLTEMVTINSTNSSQDNSDSNFSNKTKVKNKENKRTKKTS